MLGNQWTDMGLLSRATRIWGTDVEIPWVAGRGQRVAGVSHYQKVLRKCAPGQVMFELVPEPRNQYDRHAVKVLLGGRQIGHLPATMSPEYQPIIRRLGRTGRVFAPGELEPWDGGLGGLLFLPRADRLALWADVPPEVRGQVGLVVRRVTLKRLKDYEQALQKVVGRRRSADVTAEIVGFETERGKYAGQLALEFRVGGETIGLLPAQNRDDAPGLFASARQGQPMQFPLTVERTDTGFRVRFELYEPVGSNDPSTMPPPPGTTPLPPPPISPMPPPPPPGSRPLGGSRPS